MSSPDKTNTPSTDDPALWRIERAAAHLAIDKKTFERRYLNTGEVTRVKIGSATRVPVVQVRALVQRMIAEATHG